MNAKDFFNKRKQAKVVGARPLTELELKVLDLKEEETGAHANLVASVSKVLDRIDSLAREKEVQSNHNVLPPTKGDLVATRVLAEETIAAIKIGKLTLNSFLIKSAEVAKQLMKEIAFLRAVNETKLEQQK